MRFIFVEASLETIPEEISKHPTIMRDARRRKKSPGAMILDDSRHHQAMKNIENREKRGRPDIIHQCLLAVLDSALEPEIYVHTIKGEVIMVNCRTRIPRNYNRFVGLMEDLFRKRMISSRGEILMSFTDLSLSELLTENTVVLREGHDRKALLERGIENITVCVGAFPHGEFEKETLKIFECAEARFAGFGDKPKTSLYATYKAICMLESACGL
ncbi:16S rRNA methyltransferase [Geoglobus acetivorans]|uniref:Ribosomal RNA small subunit methyltransferase Nep1 n=1 Tax=Geoglobus acetivorans TaxID=565033 RepID=A0ABZ3H4B1_GEOAI|nr:16S rRNA methyltransferase [Geoglobus acetivorans]